MVSTLAYIVIITILGSAKPQLTNPRLVDHVEYFTRLTQQLVYKLEENDWCNFRIPDIHQHINLTFYEWTAVMDVEYTNGFLLSLGSVNLRADTVLSSLNDTHSFVSGRLQMNDLVTGYDVLAKTEDGEERYTGTYKTLRVDIELNVRKDRTTNEITTAASMYGNSPQSGAIMEFMPTNRVTEVMSRTFFPYTPSYGGWASINIAPVLNEIAKTSLEFPSLCYNNCHF